MLIWLIMIVYGRQRDVSNQTVLYILVQKAIKVFVLVGLTGKLHLKKAAIVKTNTRRTLP